jgi:glycosyltransferase involved in cell wall biosynthesis
LRVSAFGGEPRRHQKTTENTDIEKQASIPQATLAEEFTVTDMDLEPGGPPSVSMVVVCRNEARWIDRCLDSVVRNDYPADRVEILVVDGDSDDGTQEILQNYASRCSRIRVLTNEGRFLPLGLNIGIRAAQGEIIMKVDAHSEYPVNYISQCVHHLTQCGASNVGGCVDAVPGSDTLFAKAAAKVLFSGFGVGNSRFRVGAGQPVWADTAYSGCYWKRSLLEVGLYDETIRRSEDIDLNSKLRAMGGRTLLVPTIRVKYHVRAVFTQFCRHALSNGYWVTFPALAKGTRFSARHFAPLAFVTGLLTLAALCFSYPAARIAIAAIATGYAACALTASVLVWGARPSPAVVLMTAFTYVTYHVLYGLGSIAGFVVGVGHFYRRPRSLPLEPVAFNPVQLAGTGSTTGVGAFATGESVQSSTGLPYVSVVLACRNEAKWIQRCLDSIAQNDYPADLMEVIVVDGESTDGTRDIVQRISGDRYHVSLIRNMSRHTAAGMNLGIRAARGDVVMKIDGHSEYPPNYIFRCVRYLREYEAANVGGVVDAVPGDDTTFAKAAAKVISCRFGVGNSLFRIGTDTPTWADTAFSGCYLRSWLLKAGLYDENLHRSQDIDLNSRLSTLGGRTLLVPSIRVKYYVQARLADFCRHTLSNGYWVTYPALVRGTRFAVRHFIPMAFLVFMLAFASLALSYSPARPIFAAAVAAYAICAIGASVLTWKSAGSPRLIFTTAATFGIQHTLYGCGSLLGVAGWVASHQPISNLWRHR